MHAYILSISKYIIVIFEYFMIIVEYYCISSFENYTITVLVFCDIILNYFFTKVYHIIAICILNTLKQKPSINCDYNVDEIDHIRCLQRSLFPIGTSLCVVTSHMSQ